MAPIAAADPLLNDKIGFERMAAHHRANKRGNVLYAVALVVVGAVIVGMGMAGLLANLPAMIVGTVSILVAVVPYLESVEHRERSKGLAVLRDDYLQDQAGSAKSDTERDQVANLLSDFYQLARKNP